MTYKAIDIARYVINYLEDSGRHISNLKLQKILYYIQAAFFSDTGLPCYEDDIVRWRHGPVVKSVYDEFRCYTDENIPKQSEIQGNDENGLINWCNEICLFYEENSRHSYSDITTYILQEDGGLEYI